MVRPELPIVILPGRASRSTVRVKFSSCSSVSSSIIVTLNAILVSPAGKMTVYGPEVKSDPPTQGNKLCYVVAIL